MPNSALEPWVVLGTLCKAIHESVWAQRMRPSDGRRGAAEALEEILGVALSAKQATRIFQGKRPSYGDIVLALRDPTKQRGLADRLSLPEKIFCSPHCSGVVEILREANAELRQGLLNPDGQRDWVIVPRPVEYLEISLDSVEQAEVDKLAATVTDGDRQHILYWHAPEPVGSGLLAYAVAGKLAADPKSGVGQTFVIRPFPDFADRFLRSEEESLHMRQAFDEGLRSVAERIGIDAHSPDLSEQLLEALVRTRSVLFVLNINLMKDVAHDCLLIKLLDEAFKRISPRRGMPAPICLVGKLPSEFEEKHRSDLKETNIRKQMQEAADERYKAFRKQYVEEAKKQGDAVRQQGGDEAVRREKTRIRMRLFRQEWERYRQLRYLQQRDGPLGARLPDDWLGPRLRTAEWYYDTLDEPLVWPHSIRMRAFLASNDATACHFDPTQGWARLAGMAAKDLPPEMQLILDEVVAHIWHIREPRQLRTLRFISTSLYWLTRAMLEFALGEKELRRFDSSAASIKTVVRYHSIVVAGSTAEVYDRFRSGLSIRSIIQDRWLRADRESRQRVHFQVAERLWKDLGEQPNLLADEFPLAPHWGHSEHIILAEMIRHLMRACEGDPGATVESQSKDDFPGSFPTRVPGESFDVHGIVNFCFGTIFWKEINSNSPKRGERAHSRRLLRQHGLFYLAAELLELMSDDGRIGEPHWALHHDHKRRYYREVAMAMLEIGELGKAQRAIERRLEVFAKDSTAPTLDARLDLVTILVTRDNLAKASAVLREAEGEFDTIPDPADPLGTPATHGEVPEARNPQWPLRYRALKLRIRAQKARLLYLEGNSEEALDIYSKMGRLPPELSTPEIVHPYIAALGATGDEKNVWKAFEIAYDAAHRCFMEQNYHDHIGYKISVAHAWRKMGHNKIAEKELDHVLHMIQSEGCSERTYLAFLLEAGRILVSQRRHARAYAVYLRPCLDRAESRGYLRTARVALHHCRTALDGLPAEVDACQEGDDFADKLRHRIEAGKETLLQGFHNFEPKYAFGMHEIPNFSAKSALQEQRSQLAEIGQRLEARSCGPSS